MNTTVERRLLTADLTLRAAPAGSNSPGILSGYAAKFGKYSQDLGGFKEKIRFGAFTRALAEKQDVRFLFNHDPNHVLGRTTSGTLFLSQDSVGLHFRVTLPNTQTGKDLQESVRRGDISQCSFAFKVADGGDVWGKDKDENGITFACRELLDVDLFDCSAVCYPAYLDTNVDSFLLTDASSLVVSPRALQEARSRGGYRPRPKPSVLVDADDRDWIRRRNAFRIGQIIAKEK